MMMASQRSLHKAVYRFILRENRLNWRGWLDVEVRVISCGFVDRFFQTATLHEVTLNNTNQDTPGWR